ncbi:hypothetical protein HWV62_5626 [Athelia sp. TMB]|nr:hypothetical protein HWV62_5626 [Athelia sp. TMB]
MSFKNTNSGFQSALSPLDINRLPIEARDAATGNYPEDGDSTSSGGYGSPTDTFSGFYPSGKSKAMLFMPEVGQDAVEVDVDTRGASETVKGWASEKYGESWDTREEAERRLQAASREV